MTIALWCLLAAVILPYMWLPVVVGERKKQLGSVDNKQPRAQGAKLEGKGARALGAHQNAFEALAVFAPAVLVAHVAKADPMMSGALAGAWVFFRILHGILYIADIDKARSGVFFLAFLSALGQFALAAMAH
ncbi:MAG TPA: MAPEG family protein [Pseudomonadota bacterium]|nr:MAPEG family protein [Pseudomonadota bacterium]